MQLRMEFFSDVERLLCEGKLKEAEKICRRFIRKNKKSFWGYYALGLVKEAQGKILKALEYFRIASFLKKDEPAPHFFIGLIRRRLNQKKESQKEFNLFKKYIRK